MATRENQYDRKRSFHRTSRTRERTYQNRLVVPAIVNVIATKGSTGEVPFDVAGSIEFGKFKEQEYGARSNAYDRRV